jgi:putative toxin-antitoxin system antitoxin component (TIGR02293 family)
MTKGVVQAERATDKGRPARPLTYLEFYRAEPSDRIRLVKGGVQVGMVKRLVQDLRVDQSVLFPALNLSVSTVNRKAQRNEPLSSDEGERVIGVAKLVGQLQAMLEDSGDPQGFDSEAWISRWLLEPLPALGGTRPLDLLDTMEGQTLVSKALAQVQGGAYA